ncbi:4Fe-4S dicluster domain-containing protein [Novispirillum sp. DQ9]|uniref:4Fe-4S dicluster domain-containing protein n=1 Tax=Novispirillum sp. DQ9 TaxID=3398612 RepID=UPI003C7BA119
MSGSATVRLRPDVALALRGQACLALRPFRAGCDACAAACPSQVLRVAPGAVTLAPGCLACGRCVAACPTGALSVGGFVKSPAAGASSAIECDRVPHKARRAGALTVTCSGGLTVGHFLQLQAKAGATDVVVLDRGWCASCPAGGEGGHPAAAAVAEAAAIVAEAGGTGRPRLDGAPLPARKAQPLAPEDVAVDAGRRRLFGPALGLEEPEAPAHDLRAPLEAPERARRLDAARRLSAGGAVPPRLLPEVTISRGCRDHRICAHVCPTRALAVREDGALVFTAETCIACGRCATTCPSGAITVEARRSTAGGHPAPEPVLLRRASTRVCAACGSDFQEYPDGTDDGLCPECRKERGLMRDAWGIGVVSQPREFAE